MKNFIKKVITSIGYIFRGRKMEEKISYLEDQVDLIKKANLSLKKELEEKKLLENQISDMKYFVKDILPEILTEKYSNKKAVYDMFLKVVARKHFKKSTGKQERSNVTDISDRSAVQ